MIALLIASVLSQAQLEVTREETRVRAEVAGCAVGALGLETGAGALAPGISAELGAILRDRYAVTARLNLATLLIMTAFSVAANFEFVVNEHILASLGLSWGGFGGFDAPSSMLVGLPARVTFSPVARASEATRRSGFALFAEGLVGYSYLSGFGLATSRRVLGPPIAMQAMLGAGYSWW